MGNTIIHGHQNHSWAQKLYMGFVKSKGFLLETHTSYMGLKVVSAPTPKTTTTTTTTTGITLWPVGLRPQVKTGFPLLSLENQPETTLHQKVALHSCTQTNYSFLFWAGVSWVGAANCITPHFAQPSFRPSKKRRPPEMTPRLLLLLRLSWKKERQEESGTSFIIISWRSVGRRKEGGRYSHGPDCRLPLHYLYLAHHGEHMDCRMKREIRIY